jgi:hypothetical protein
VAQAVNGTKGSKPKLNAPGQDKQRNRQPDFERQGSILKKGHPAHATTETLSAILHLGVFPTKFNSLSIATYDVKGEQDSHKAVAVIDRADRVRCKLKSHVRVGPFREQNRSSMGGLLKIGSDYAPELGHESKPFCARPPWAIARASHSVLPLVDEEPW